MNKKSTSNVSQTDWKRIKAMDDEDIDLSDIPEITEDQIANSKLRLNGKPFSKGKVRVNIFLDAEIVAYFKTMAGGRGYQTLINESLKSNIRNNNLESTIRRIIREELQSTDKVKA